MIIDFHAHARPGRGDVADLIAAMDHHGIDKAVVSAYVPLMQYSHLSQEFGKELNDYVLDVANRYPDRIIPFCCVIPWLEGAEELFEHYVVDKGTRGLKLHPLYQHFTPTEPKIVPVLRKAIELDVPVLFHTGPVFDRWTRVSYGDIIHFDNLALAFPDLKMVLAHADVLGPGPRIAAKHPNVYLDTSESNFVKLSQVLPGFGENVLRWLRGINKFIFGSDVQPDRLYRFEENLRPILELDLDDNVRSQILGGNAAKLLSLC